MPHPSWPPLLPRRRVAPRPHSSQERERHDDDHRHVHGDAVAAPWVELPLTYGVERRVIQDGDRLEHARIVHFAVGPNRGFDEDVATDPRRHGSRGIDGFDILDLPGAIDSFTDAERACRRLVRRLERRSATSTTMNAAWHAVARAENFGGCALTRGI